MQLTLQLTDDVARSLSGAGPVTEEAQAVVVLARELGIELRPLHPGTRDVTLKAYFAADVQDPAVAERAAAQLRSHPAVTAAYVKPADALP